MKRKTDIRDRFAKTVAEEVAEGIVWEDYRHRLSRFLLPRPGDSPEDAAVCIRGARAHELRMDLTEPGTPGTPPAWPHWTGTDDRP